MVTTELMETSMRQCAHTCRRFSRHRLEIAIARRHVHTVPLGVGRHCHQTFIAVQDERETKEFDRSINRRHINAIFTGITTT